MNIITFFMAFLASLDAKADDVFERERSENRAMLRAQLAEKLKN